MLAATHPTIMVACASMVDTLRVDRGSARYTTCIRSLRRSERRFLRSERTRTFQVSGVKIASFSTSFPTQQPTEEPSEQPTALPTEEPTDLPTGQPTSF